MKKEEQIVTRKELDTILKYANDAKNEKVEMDTALPLIELTVASCSNHKRYDIALLIVSLLPLCDASSLIALKDTLEKTTERAIKRELVEMLKNGDIDLKDLLKNE